MGKVLPRRLGDVFDSFDSSREIEFVGKEFKQVFPPGLTSTVNDVRVEFNDTNLDNVLVRGIIVNFSDGSEQIVFEDYGNGYFSWIDKNISLGGGQYFGVQTVGLLNGTPPGGKVIIIAKSNIMR